MRDQTAAYFVVTSRRQYVALDGLRGVAAVAVMLYHYGLWVNARWLVPHGYLAVDFFFCLSGFILAHAYEQKFLAGSITLRRFVVLRLIRLYPLIAISMVLGAAASLAAASLHGTWQLPAFARDLSFGLLLTPQFWPGVRAKMLVFPLNGAAWSLFFELFVNFAWAACPWVWTTKRMAGVSLAALALVCVAAVGAGDLAFGAGPGLGFVAAFFRVTCAFGFGVLIFRLHKTGVGFKLQLLPAAVLLAAVLQVPGSRFDAAFDLVCAFALFPALVLGAAKADETAAPAMLWLGFVSYPLYALHSPIFDLAQVFAEGLWNASITAGSLPAVVVLSILAAAVMSKAVDAPLRARITRVVFKQPADAPRPQSSASSI